MPLAPSPPPPFRPPYAGDDAALIRAAIAAARLDPAAEARVDARAAGFIAAIRARAGAIGGIEDFLREFGLSTREGLALMVLAEALLRVPDAATQDRLIEDKLGGAGWAAHAGRAETWFVSASTWALGLSAKIVAPGENPDGIIAGLVRRLGQPTVRTATRQAMRFLGHHFVLGETIGEALKRARSLEAEGFRHSYDMLGEGARTADDADRYFRSYAAAIAAIGAAAGKKPLPDRPGISVKLSALHPRYEAVKRDRVMAELVPRLVELALAARAHDLNFTVDAEEADRLELSLDVIAAALADPRLAGWDGFGLAVQAYQKRAGAVIDWLGALAAALDRRLMVRLVKGAYWDTEVKRAQERGLDDYPVFTRKAATDQNYLACARHLLDLRPRIFPQFATHNALTIATILEMAGDAQGFEFQRLHGMGEALHAAVHEAVPTVSTRIYAPVGGHRDLLAYLVRRLLENGANSSFVSVVGDKRIPIKDLLVKPESTLEGGARARHARLPLPRDLYGARKNSAGLEFGHAATLGRLAAALAAADGRALAARPIAPVAVETLPSRPVLEPADGVSVVGAVAEATPEAAGPLVAAAKAGFGAWSRTPVEQRAAALERLAHLLEAQRDRLVALLAREAGKTLPDGIAEVREAADFCRYYAAEARRLFVETAMPGPTGEADRLVHRGRGVFLAISPWNFPLAIFLGQVTAALAAGNTVVAKPAEQTPLVAAEAVRLAHEAGVPADALVLAPGDGALGAALVAHRDVAGVVFTGSTETAFAINRALAAKDGPIVPLVAETGGLNAMIVDATALPEQVTDDVIASAFRSAGQRCSALRLLFLQEDVADRMLAMIEGAAAELTLGDPRDPATDLGPVIDGAAKEALDAHVAAMRQTARVRLAGPAPGEGHFVAPAIIELADAAALTKEVFGPVLHVVRWRAGELDRVIAAVAASGYGLTLGIHSRIDETVERIVAALPVGNVYVNRNIIGAVVGTQPFGGSGLSGTGPKAGGPNYLARFALEQVVSVNTAAAGGNASLMAMGDG
ncbi:bifunctional proline dehydrogenase/L-glutamate gamma-semialdehyde dehydrogenase PutA [Prosthecomicrobium pneumaticum]|uniref:Bifunctional protein PutA n=1 Tax=Prosthecomicrobium pneumaticum TaxID=81895 RepID=A0A7W9FPB7_9HYPH|nr:bifunctional proline dehydrogenase/L-glutamate gamma-semialdehyde dehydrogenase PutA [Prosthecomicrobium pneumaticum]MBB5754305.1 RHH-type proline utilization regulon transcriptional repressor/proline dehydrogenase/delta 1-pyrroline-5-carboxylate dehydrogenase [Prosthecomicrobium pneumaticum]